MGAPVRQIRTQGNPIQGVHDELSKRFEEMGLLEAIRQKSIPFPSPQTFREMLFDFMVLQELDWVLTCPRCGEDPQTVIVDGTNVSIKAEYYGGEPITKVYVSPLSPRTWDTSS